MSDLIAWFVAHDALWRGTLFVVATIALVWLINTVLRSVLRRIGARADARNAVWEAAVVRALDRPLRWGIWVVGISIIARFLTRAHELPVFTTVFQHSRDIAIIFIIVWFLIGATRRIETALLAGSGEAAYDPMAVDAVGKLARLAVVVMAILMAMPIFGFSISGILAFGGIGGIAIGFAAQGLVANLFGGLTVYASRPFRVGDVIIMPGTDVIGTVERIGWRATRVMGFNRQPFYVPNSMFNTAILVNYSRMDARPIQEDIRVRFTDAERIPQIVEAAEAMLRQHPALQPGSTRLRLDGCDTSSFRLQLYALTSGTDYDVYVRTKEELLLKIAAIIREAGAEIAVPASVVQVPGKVHLAGETRAP